MLSYRHGYHAGNYADVLKHIVLVEMLEHLCKKDKPFECIDTHAGSGLYDLKSGYAKVNSEFVGGIAKLKREEWPELAAYFAAIDKRNTQGGHRYYPGSPAIIADYLRPLDRAWWFELHSTDFDTLNKLGGGNRRIRVKEEDGYKGLLSLVPPHARRGLVLIDPSYEVKDDYHDVFDTVNQAYKKWPTGSYAIWYPVVDRARIEGLQRRFVKSGIKNIQQFELGIAADTVERGMTSAGMIVVNPPWTLKAKMDDILPRLATLLTDDGAPHFRSEVLVAE